MDHLNFDEVHSSAFDQSDFDVIALSSPVVEMPDAVLKSLKETPSEKKKQDIKALNVPMNSFLLACAERYKTNITVDPALTMAVSVNLRQVDLNDIFEHIGQFQQIDYERTKAGWLVKPAQVGTRLYTVDHVNLIRWGHSSTMVSRASNTNTALALTPPSKDGLQSDGQADSAFALSSSFDNSSQWTDLERMLNSLRQSPAEESITINPGTGVISVTAYTKTHRLIDKFIRHMNYKLSQQIIIEAKILEVSLFEKYQSGVNLQGSKVSYESIKGTFKYYTTASTFNDIVQLIKTQGRVNTISSPKVSVINQQRAIMKVGNDSYYATGTSSTQPMDETTSQVNNLVAYQPFFSGLVLDVTPHVDAQQDISLHVHPYISIVTPDYLNMPLQNNVTGELITNAYLRMAATEIRETDTVVKAKSGEVIVIAGLMSRGYNKEHGSPGVNVVTSSNDKATNTEIVILIRPVLMNSSKWKKLLINSRSRLERMGEEVV